MEIRVQDTIAEFQPLFTDRSRPKERLERVLEALTGADGAARAWRARKRLGQAVVDAAQTDGFDVVFGQQGWGLFNPSRKVEASEWAFAQFVEHDLLGQAKRWLEQFAACFEPSLLPEQMEVMILPADPANRSVMIGSSGLQAFGGVVDALMMLIWPSAGNLARFGPVLGRAFAQNVRWHHFSLQMAEERAPTLADHLVLEGLAASFVAAQFPQLVAAPWAVPFTAPDDWEDALRFVAGFYGLERFDEVVFNVYGMRREMGSERPPKPLPLDEDELAYSEEILRAALAEDVPSRIAAYLYGDEIVAAQGYATVGLSPFAGFAVAYVWVQEYLQRSRVPLVEAFARPTEEILAGSMRMDADWKGRAVA